MTTLEAELIAEVERLHAELESTQNSLEKSILERDRLLSNLKEETEKRERLEKEFSDLLETMKSTLKQSFSRELDRLESNYQKELEALKKELSDLQGV